MKMLWIRMSGHRVLRSSANIQQWASPFTAGVSWLSRPDQLTRLQTTSTWDGFQQAECSNREVCVERMNICRYQFVQRWGWNVCDQQHNQLTEPYVENGHYNGVRVMQAFNSCPLTKLRGGLKSLREIMSSTALENWKQTLCIDAVYNHGWTDRGYISIYTPKIRPSKLLWSNNDARMVIGLSISNLEQTN